MTENMTGNSGGTGKRVSKPKKPTAKPEKFPRKSIQVIFEPSDNEEAVARKRTAVVTSNEAAALRVMKGAEQKSGYWESIDVPALMDQLRDQAAAVNRGDLAQAEAMLMNQASALQSLFARLAERSMGCDQIPGFEANMRMALRAQSQCRATLETLAEIKNPQPTAFIKQQNIGVNQQVNNDAAPLAREKTINHPNELLTEGVHHGTTLDTGRTSAAIGTNQELEAVGAVNRG